MPRGGGARRPDQLRQVRAQGPRRDGRARLDLRQRRAQAGGLAHLHADARRRWRHPGRPHRVPRGRRRVLRRDRHGLCHARLRLDPSQHPGQRERTAVRRHVGLVGAHADGPEQPHDPERGHECLARQRRVPVRHHADRRHRRLPGARTAGHLHGRARLGAAPASRVRHARLRHADGRGRRARPRQRRLSGDREHPPGEGLPGLGQRHRPRPLPARGRARLGGEDEDRHRLPRP